MTKSRGSQKRVQSPGEEIANGLSHAVGFLAAAALSPVLIMSALRRGGAAGVVGASIFAVTMLLLYATSALYHLLPRNKAKDVFHVLNDIWWNVGEKVRLKLGQKQQWVMLCCLRGGC